MRRPSPDVRPLATTTPIPNIPKTNRLLPASRATLAALLLWASAAPITTAATAPAFPGAQGHGATAVGGRGGRLIEVTHLGDSGPGSLRAALSASGPRIVVFRVAGTIRLRDTVRIDHGYLTVAGQTAPGDGIVLRGSGRSLLLLRGGVHDVVLRYFRLRNGSGEADGFGADNINVGGGRDLIFDHLSLSWASDENLALWRRTEATPISRVSVQRSILAEGLAGHSNGLIVGGYRDTSDPDRPIDNWRLITDISIHQNLFIHNSHRNPRVAAAGVRVINNVIYNWRARIGSTTHGAICDLINNYAKVGPILAETLRRDRGYIADHLYSHEHLNPDSGERYPAPSLYSSGNIVEPGLHTEPRAGDWNLWRLGYSEPRYQPLPVAYRRAAPLPPATYPVATVAARDAYRSVLADVGANARLDCHGRWIRRLDAVDTRLLREVRIDSGPATLRVRPRESDYPDIEPEQACPDRDHDGMPDPWERHHGFDPDDPADGPLDADRDGYSNLEEYLNGSDPHLSS